MRYVLILCSLLVALSGGCSTVSHYAGKVTGLQSIDAANAQIAAVQSQEDAKLATLQGTIETQKKAIRDVDHQQSQEAANHTFLAQVTYQLDPAPDEFASTMNGEVQAAATTLVAPDAATVNGGIAKIKKLLADKQTLIANLNVEVATAKAKADQLATAKTSAESKITSIKGEEAQLKQDDAQKIATIQTAKDEATKTALTKDAALLDNKAEINALKTKLTIGAAIIAALLIAAAVFSPVFKQELVELAFVFGGAAVGIPYVEAWMVGAGAAVALLTVLCIMAFKHNTVTQVAATVTSTPTPLAVAAATTTSTTSTVTPPTTVSTPAKTP